MPHSGITETLSDAESVRVVHTGVVESILRDREDHNIGVDIDGDHENPTPYYYNTNNLEIIGE